jgi:hypothetical protein
MIKSSALENGRRVPPRSTTTALLEGKRSVCDARACGVWRASRLARPFGEVTVHVIGLPVARGRP